MDKVTTDTQLPLAGVKLGFVDDDKATARVYVKWLEAAGAEVFVSHSYSEFREALEGPNGWAAHPHRAPDLFIADLILPDGTGIDVVSSWRKYFPQLPILILTAFATVENAVDSMKSGAFDFLRKPIQAEELILVLQRAHEHGRLIRENETLSSAVRIFGMAQTLSAIHEKYGLLKTLGRLLHREVKAQECFVFLYDAGKKQVECLLDTRVPGLPRLAPETVISNVLFPFIDKEQQGTEAALNTLRIDASEPPSTVIQKTVDGHALVIQLKSVSGNKAFVVLFEREDPEELAKKKEELLPIILQAARAFQSADAAEKMANLSYIDDLTGLYNQRYLHMTLNNEVARADRYGAPVALLFLDLDKFKAVNDKHGHIVGSHLLKEAAKLLRQNVRDSDILLRYGGDEFVVILPNTRVAGASILAERIKDAFDKTLFDVRQSTHIQSAFNLHVTSSIGGACYPETAQTVRDLIQQADDAMYEAKRLGKNCVCFAPEIKKD